MSDHLSRDEPQSGRSKAEDWEIAAWEARMQAEAKSWAAKAASGASKDKRTWSGWDRARFAARNAAVKAGVE